MNSNLISFYLNWFSREGIEHALGAEAPVARGCFHAFPTDTLLHLMAGMDHEQSEKEFRTHIRKQWAKWAKSVPDILKKRFLLFPFCEDSHFSLFVVCNAGVCDPSLLRFVV